LCGRAQHPSCSSRSAASRTSQHAPLHTPQAFVAFESQDEARRACQKDRETFGDKWGDRYVRVYPTLESDVSDMQQAVLQQGMGPQQVRRSWRPQRGRRGRGSARA
jgi:hypothetical protein